INSPGGSFTALTAIYDTMQYIKPEITTVCLGQAASAAAVLLAAGAPGKRLALPNARILIHQPAMGGEGGGGQASDLEIQANEIMRMREWLEETLAFHSGRTKEQVSTDIERDKILTAKSALEYGLVDQVLESRMAPAAQIAKRPSPLRGPSIPPQRHPRPSARRGGTAWPGPCARPGTRHPRSVASRDRTALRDTVVTVRTARGTLPREPRSALLTA